MNERHRHLNFNIEEWFKLIEYFVGSPLDRGLYDECAICRTMVSEQYLRQRLADRKGSVSFITTPYGHNWVQDTTSFGKGDTEDIESAKYQTEVSREGLYGQR